MTSQQQKRNPGFLKSEYEPLFHLTSKVVDEKLKERKEALSQEDLKTLPQAKNIIDWIETPGFLHSEDELDPSQPFLYPKSHEILRDYFELLCPYCNDLSAVQQGRVHKDDEIRFEYRVEEGVPRHACRLCGVTYLEALRAGRLTNYIEMALCVGMRAGKALALDTPIPTPEGWTSMGDLEDGDVVFDEAGKTCRVLKAHEVQIGRPCFRVWFSDGTSVVADADHRWVTTTYTERKNAARRASGKAAVPQVRTTAEIAASVLPSNAGPRPGYNHHIPLAKPLQLDHADLLIHPYALGCWLGDGVTVAARLYVDDEEIIEQIRACGEPVFRGSAKFEWFLSDGVRRGSPEGKRSTFQGRLRRLGVLGNKHIPAAYLRSSYEQRLALLQGLMDTDGTAGEDGSCEFTTTKQVLAEGMQELLATLGIRSSIGEGRATLNGRDVGPKWRLCFTTDTPVFRLTRKLERQRNRPGGASTEHRSIVSVEPVESVPVRCITVDSPSHLYLCGPTMIPTHNTYLAAEIATYILHRLLGCSSVRRTYGEAEGAALEIAFVASTALQAKDTIWATFRALFTNSPWFKTYLLNASRREESLPPGSDPLVRVMDSRMEFNEPGIVCMSLNSNSGGLAGRTRIFAFLDELARFDGGDSKVGAAEVYRVLSNSLKTLRVASKRLKKVGIMPPVEPAMISISSPIHEEDMIMQLIRESKQIPEKKIYSQHLRTTEMNPTFTEEDFEAEKMSDPIGAERDFGARPMGLGVRLFPQSEPIYAACRKRSVKLLDWEEEFFDEGGTGYVRLVLKRCVRDLVTPRFIHCDPGQTGDSFGIVIGHIEGFIPEYVVVIDEMIEIRPLSPPKGSKMKPREVYFESVLKFILELRKFINVAKVQFDQWESVQYIQRLRSHGIPVTKHTIEADDYKHLRIDVMGGRVHFPTPEVPEYDRRLRKVPVSKALHELKMLEWVTPDKKVDHPKGGSKDIADCVCGVHRILTWDIFDDSVDRRKRPSSPPEGRGYHVSQYQRLQKELRVGRVVRFAR